MILEATRIISEALSDSTIGVNAQLASLPKDAADSTPPRIIAVLDPTTNDDAAAGKAGLDFPVLLVTVGPIRDMEGEVATVKRGAKLSVLVSYITHDYDKAQAVTNALYTLRAVQRTIRELMRNENISRRQRNNICLVACLGMEAESVKAAVGDGVFATGIMVLELQLRDLAP